MDWVPINWGIIKNPLNWIIILLMVLIAGVGADILLRAINSNSTPVTD